MCMVALFCHIIREAMPGVGSLFVCGLKFAERLSNGADIAYTCKHSACLHTQKCAHSVSTEITHVNQYCIN